MGPKTEADLLPMPKTDKKATKSPKIVNKPGSDEQHNIKQKVEEESLNILDVMKKVNFHKPGENYKTDGYIVTENTPKLLQDHLKVTGGKVSLLVFLMLKTLQRLINITMHCVCLC